jgi:hypothetical protein
MMMWVCSLANDHLSSTAALCQNIRTHVEHVLDASWRQPHFLHPNQCVWAKKILANKKRLDLLGAMLMFSDPKRNPIFRVCFYMHTAIVFRIALGGNHPSCY